jgi:chromosome segregation ATPase
MEVKFDVPNPFAPVAHAAADVAGAAIGAGAAVGGAFNEVDRLRGQLEDAHRTIASDNNMIAELHAEIAANSEAALKTQIKDLQATVAQLQMLNNAANAKLASFKAAVAGVAASN